MTVTAVMLTGKPERRPLATIAVECFQRQTHTDAELLIVNHSGTPFAVPDERVRELLVENPRSLGDLRNVGLEHARGEHLITWDDDDWHHPRRIELQLSACAEGYDAVVLRSYLVLDLTTGLSFGSKGPFATRRGHLFLEWPWRSPFGLWWGRAAPPPPINVTLLAPMPPEPTR